MNKEQQELIDEVYENYLKEQQKAYKIEYDKLSSNGLFEIDLDWQTLTQEDFINKIKTDTEFSKQWGLKIEERELIQGERLQLLWKVCREENIPPDSKELDDFWLRYNEIMSKYSIPTRLITITYNDTKLESYE